MAPLSRLEPVGILTGIGGHTAHEEVRRALVARAKQIQGVEMAQRCIWCTEVDGATLHQDQHLQSLKHL